MKQFLKALPIPVQIKVGPDCGHQCLAAEIAAPEIVLRILLKLFQADLFCSNFAAEKVISFYSRLRARTPAGSLMLRGRGR